MPIPLSIEVDRNTLSRGETARVSGRFLPGVLAMVGVYADGKLLALLPTFPDGSYGTTVTFNTIGVFDLKAAVDFIPMFGPRLAESDPTRVNVEVPVVGPPPVALPPAVPLPTVIEIPEAYPVIITRPPVAPPQMIVIRPRPPEALPELPPLEPAPVAPAPPVGLPPLAPPPVTPPIAPPVTAPPAPRAPEPPLVPAASVTVIVQAPTGRPVELIAGATYDVLVNVSNLSTVGGLPAPASLTVSYQVLIGQGPEQRWLFSATKITTSFAPAENKTYRMRITPTDADVGKEGYAMAVAYHKDLYLGEDNVWVRIMAAPSIARPATPEAAPPAPAPAPAPTPTLPGTNAELLDEMRRLEALLDRSYDVDAYARYVLIRDELIRRGVL